MVDEKKQAVVVGLNTLWLTSLLDIGMNNIWIPIIFAVGLLIGLTLGWGLARNGVQPWWWDQTTRLDDYEDQMNTIERCLDEMENEK